MAILLKDTDLTDWYNELNTIRQKTNIALGTVTVPNVDKTKALSSTINTFFDQINALKTNEYLQHAYGWDTWTTAIGDGVQSKEKIVSSLKDTIESQLDNLSLVCGNCIVTNRTQTDYSKTLNNHGGSMSFVTTATTNTTVTRFDHNGSMSFGTRSFSERQNDRDGRTTFGTSSFTRTRNSRDGTAGFNRSSYSNTSNRRCSFTARPSCDQTFNATRDDVLDGNRRAGFLPNRSFSTTSGASFAAWTGNSTDSRGGNSIRDTTTFGTSSFTERTNERGGTTTFGTSSFTDRRNSHGGSMSFSTTHTTNTTITTFDHNGTMSFGTSSFSHNPVTTNVTKNMSFQVKDSTAAGQVTNTKIVN